MDDTITNYEEKGFLKKVEDGDCFWPCTEECAEFLKRDKGHATLTDLIFYLLYQGVLFVMYEYIMFLQSLWWLVGSVCFYASVRVRGGSADRSDVVVLGVSEPTVHWHALSFGELLPPHKQHSA